MTTEEIQARMDVLTSAVNQAIAEVDASDLFRASIVTCWDNGGGPERLRVEVRELGAIALEARALRRLRAKQ